MSETDYINSEMISNFQILSAVGGIVSGLGFVIMMRSKPRTLLDRVSNYMFLTPLVIPFIGFMVSLLWFQVSVVTILLETQIQWPLGFVMVLFLASMMGLLSLRKRDKVTDIRFMNQPSAPDSFDIMDYYTPGLITVGVNVEKKGRKKTLVQIAKSIWNERHLQLAGSSGTGKTVAAQMILKQLVHEHDPVFVFDPKGDKWLPHVLHAQAKKSGVPFHFVDLNAGKPAQINPFIGATRPETQELMYAAFGLTSKGSDADHYRKKDRKGARDTAKIMGSMKVPSLRGALPEVLEQVPHEGFCDSFEELSELDSLNADEIGVDFEKVTKEGGVVYIVSSTRNEQVKTAAKMLITKLVQVVERRDPLQEYKTVTTFFDEFKYLCCAQAMEVFGTARDKGLHAIVGHQSLADFYDIPKDMEPRAVYGSVIDNTRLKLIYQVEDPETCDWLAKRSGKKTTVIESNRADKDDSERMEREQSTHYIDPNVIMTLPKQVAVSYGFNNLATLCGTSPQSVERTMEATRINALEVAKPEKVAVMEKPKAKKKPKPKKAEAAANGESPKQTQQQDVPPIECYDDVLIDDEDDHRGQNELNI